MNENFNQYLAVLKKYAIFSGRSNRREYWTFVLFHVLVTIILSTMDSIMESRLGASFLVGIYALATLVPSLAVGVRRLHDTNRSGWWVLIGFIPVIGSIILIFFLAADSQPGDNQYGPNPKSLDAAPVAQ
ncbi:MAG: hypothetical protein UY92_C0014G0009 [Candidatus Magasanikbacteria bacterium GW2011_GWA2_56_11]|uniref:DUF805 domain-containing protein n=1 Tax=Candidatus Magasanikbacteria bacterium GW2011_GWA2_56_11 TaxID=1619044 RepID=A0A0G2B8D7_9BACT|nr:MAG: hypothetical protein UY92_C0014G0009 [Candidatus Magasanikbacteria bacterium GW2011_GWA2_56_11]